MYSPGVLPPYLVLSAQVCVRFRCQYNGWESTMLFNSVYSTVLWCNTELLQRTCIVACQRAYVAALPHGPRLMATGWGYQLTVQ